MNHLITVPFHQQSIMVVEKDGKRWVALKPICEALGLDWSAQFRRLRRDDILSSVVAMMATTGADGKQYEMLFLGIAYLNGWLFGIDANRVKPELRERVLDYQRECYIVLDNYFHEREQWALTKAEDRNNRFERAYFERYPERRAIRMMALQGEPYWFIGLSVRRTAGTVGKAIRHMIQWGVMTQQALNTARIGVGAWWAYRRKCINQLSLGF